MIQLLPYRRLVFDSPLGKEEILRRLIPEVAERRWTIFETRPEKFEGVIAEDGFKVNRIIRNRNSFLPVIEGHFHPLVHGVRVEVRMRLHLLIMVFSVLWLAFVGEAAVATILQIYSLGKVEGNMVIPFAMLLFYYLLMTLAFTYEANKATKILSRMLEAEPQP